jgi:hypothetical protein
MDAKVLALPCAGEDHYPFNLQIVGAPGAQLFPHAWVRTVSGAWDGCGGRTDLHEMFGLLWAVLLRANGIASAAFIDERGFCGEAEIYSRALLFLQPFDRFFPRSDQRTPALLKAHTAEAVHALHAVLSLDDPAATPPRWAAPEKAWAEAIRAHLGGGDSDDLAAARINPDWRYYRAFKRGITWLQLPPEQMVFLRAMCRHYEPATCRQGRRLALTAGGLHHSIALDALRRAQGALKAMEPGSFATSGDGSTRWNEHGALVIPLENRLVLIGGHFLVSVTTNCGYQAFMDARSNWLEQNRQAALIFGAGAAFKWIEPVHPGRFEELVEALLGVEPNVFRVRSTGPPNDRDQGRDLVIQRAAVLGLAADQPTTTIERILVQVKTRNRTVGKGDVRDIRDTIEHHHADGYLLIAYPRPSGDLIRHLEDLSERGVSADWWDRNQLEERLRKHPDILTRFSDQVTNVPPR